MLGCDCDCASVGEYFNFRPFLTNQSVSSLMGKVSPYCHSQVCDMQHLSMAKQRREERFRGSWFQNLALFFCSFLFKSQFLPPAALMVDLMLQFTL